MIPPRAPQWVDLGLPSGTLWLDRLVGAQAPNAIGLFYQWGDIVGHGIAEGYNFSSENYEAKELNLISSDLDDAHDAARAYYGPSAKMPSTSQLEELINNCVVSSQEDGVLLITSNINGHSIKIRGNGCLVNLDHMWGYELRSWSNSVRDRSTAWSVHYENLTLGLYYNSRSAGYNIMAVHA